MSIVLISEGNVKKKNQLQVPNKPQYLYLLNRAENHAELLFSFVFLIVCQFAKILTESLLCNSFVLKCLKLLNFVVCLFVVIFTNPI